MIYPTTNIQWLDMNQQLAFDDTIQKLFQDHAHNSTHFRYNTTNEDFIINSIVFDESIKIRELVGWSTVTSINKINRRNAKVNWYRISRYGNFKELLVSDDELIPLYKYSNKHTGFHGETKYGYILTSPEKMSCDIDNRMRIYPINEDHIEFVPYIIDQYKRTDINYGYQIITKSKFYNGNDFHLYGSNSVSLEDATNWYK